MLVDIFIFIIAVFLAESIYRYRLSKLAFLTTKPAEYQKRFKTISVSVLFVFFIFLAVVTGLL